MGGAAGHLQHCWEATDMTFTEIKELINDSFNGKLENVTEKLDGQNLSLSYKDGLAIVARTGRHFKNAGQLGIDITEIWDYFGKTTPDTVREAYKKAIQDFQTIFNKDPNKWSEIFQEGRFWINAEILYEPTENIIHYGLNQIRIHNLIEVGIFSGAILKTIPFEEKIENGSTFELSLIHI
jgi:hypothetical protein